MKTKFYKIISMLVVISILMSHFGTMSFAADAEEPVKIAITSDRESYGLYDVAQFSVRVTNISENTLENVDISTGRDSLRLFGNKNHTSASVEKLEPGETATLDFRATVSYDSVNFLKKIWLFFSILWARITDKNDAKITVADTRQSATQKADFSFGNVTASVTAKVLYNMIIKETPKYSVSTSSEYATLAAAEVLENGGNAVDAAITAAYVLNVVEPYASGIGGGGGMLVYDPASNDYTFLNYASESAESGTTERNIGVPGFVSGMQKAYELFATVPFANLLAPAINYAENGFTVSEYLSLKIDQAVDSFNTFDIPFLDVYEGDTLVQNDIADMLKTIRDKGSSDFYNGTIANKIVSGTTFTSEDLANYKTIVSKPVISDFAGYTIASAPSPFSGVMLIQMLNMMELKNTPSPSANPDRYMRDMISFRNASLSERTKYSCDRRFNKTKSAEYLTHMTDEYLTDLLNSTYEPGEDDIEGENTTHIAIVDSNGMTVSMTNTISTFWGARFYLDGIIFNNSMEGFTNTGVNKYAAGKRPRTYMTPTIMVNNENGSTFAIGTPGGKVITTVLAQIISDIFLYGKDAKKAVTNQRYMINSDSSVVLEVGMGTSSRISLDGLDFNYTNYSRNEYFGSVNLAGRNGAWEYYAVADARRNGYSVAEN